MEPPVDKSLGAAVRQLWRRQQSMREGQSVPEAQELLGRILCDAGLLPDVERATRTIQSMGKGNGRKPRNPAVVEHLAVHGVSNLDMGEDWLYRFLKGADFPEDLCHKRIRDLLGKQPLETELEVRSNPLAMLRARPSSFVGRKDELQHIQRALVSAWPVCLIYGVGGAGKTTLALEVAYACGGEPRGDAIRLAWPHFSHIVWINAEATSITLSKFLDMIAAQLDYKYQGLAKKAWTRSALR